MITDKTLVFLRDLKENNSREWFQAHKPEYEASLADFFDTVVRFADAVADFDVTIAAARPDPKSCIMRIYRDTRFSKDKAPYKTGFFAFVGKGGWKAGNAGYYLHLEPGSSFAGGGLYMPDKPILEKSRRAIDTNCHEWLSIVSDAALLSWFPAGVQPSGATKRPPKGYDKDNPAIEYLKFKGYYTQRYFSDDELTSGDFAEKLALASKAVLPMVRFLNEAIGGC
ncbi:MAG: DUF2461 domain-containing protein [Chlorobiaceae bacterium]|nr:DUF2461 domain-containing protein [Chlorobiaceae bacterium]